MTRDNPHIRRRRKRGTGGVHKRINEAGRLRWVASWIERDRRRTRIFDTRRQAERFLAGIEPSMRDVWRDHLRELLWAELQARLRFGSAEIVSTKSQKWRTSA